MRHRVTRHHREDGGAAGAGVGITIRAIIGALVSGAEGEACGADKLEHVVSWCHSGETVDAAGIRGRGVDGSSATVQQTHRDTADTRFSYVLEAVLIHIIPHTVGNEASRGRIVRERVVTHAEEFAVRTSDAETEAKDGRSRPENAMTDDGQEVRLTVIVGGGSVTRIPVMRGTHLNRA